MILNDMAQEAHRIACERGWWPLLASHGATPNDPVGFDPTVARRLALQDKPFPQAIALLHEEVSEAWQFWKKNQGSLDPVGLEGVPGELADILIRVLDMAAAYRIDLGRAVATKHAFNAQRSHRHGGKIA